MRYKTLWTKTLLLWLFSIVKLPMVFWLKPKITGLNDNQGIITMRFRRRTKNHVNSMYFGVLCVGAELAAGVLAMNLIRQQKQKVTFLFKDFSAEFLKRCENNVHFICDEGKLIKQALHDAARTKERQNIPLKVTALIPEKFGNEPICHFKLTLSLKTQ